MRGLKMRLQIQVKGLILFLAYLVGAARGLLSPLNLIAAFPALFSQARRVRCRRQIIPNAMTNLTLRVSW